MTALLDRALGVVLTLPTEEQDEIARAILSLAGGDARPEPVDPAHLAGVLEGLRQASEGRLATGTEVTAAFDRFGR